MVDCRNPGDAPSRHGQSVSVTTLAMLAGIGAVTGRSILVEPAPGFVPIPPGLNVLFPAENPNVSMTVRNMFGPLVQLQARFANRFGNYEADWLRQEEARLVCERQRYLEGALYQDPDVLAYYDEPLRALRGSRPFCIVDPRPGELMAASQSSFDQCGSVIAAQPGSTTRLIDHWTTSQGTAELEQIVSGWYRRPNYRPNGNQCLEGGPQFAVSLALVASQQDVARLMTAPEIIQSGLAGTFLAVGNGNERGESASISWDHQAGWHNFIERLFDWRRQGHVWICRPAPVARQVIERFGREVTVLSAQLPAQHRHMVASWTEQTWRVALGLHIVGGRVQDAIEEETVETAVQIVRWLIAQQCDSSRPDPDPVAAFIENSLHRDEGGSLTVTECYEAYRHYCHLNHYVPLPRQRFKGAIADSVERLGGSPANNLPRCLGPDQRITDQRGWRGVALVDQTVPLAEEPTKNDGPSCPGCPNHQLDSAI